MIYAVGGYGYLSTGLASAPSQTEVDSTADDSVVNNSRPQSPECLNSCERFNFDLDRWEQLPPMRDRRRALAVVTLPDGVFAIGGYDGQRYLSSVEKFCPQQQRWIQMKSMQS